MLPLSRRKASFFARFLSGFLIAGQLAWGLPAAAETTLRPAQPAQSSTGLVQRLSAGAEEFLAELNQRMRNSETLSVAELTAWAADYGKSQAELFAAIRRLGPSISEPGWPGRWRSFFRVLTPEGMETDLLKSYMAIKRDGDWHDGSAVLFELPDGRWLLQRQASDGRLNWSAAGHRELGFSRKETAAQESLEESSLILDLTRLQPVINPLPGSRGLWRFMSSRDHAGPAYYDKQSIYRMSAPEPLVVKNFHITHAFRYKLTQEEWERFPAQFAEAKAKGLIEEADDFIPMAPADVLESIRNEPDRYSPYFLRYFADPLGDYLVKQTAKPAAGAEEDFMRPAAQTRFRVEGMLAGTFDELDNKYGGSVSGAVDRLLGQKTGRPVRVLLIGVGRGNEALGLKNRYGENVEVWSINRKEGLFYDRASFEKQLGALEPELREKALDHFEQVRSRVRISDVESQTPSFDVPDGRFDLVVFGNAVSIYFRDKAEVFNRLLDRLTLPGGRLLAFMDNLELETPYRNAEPHILRRNYLNQLAAENRAVVERAGELGLSIRNDGNFRIPLELSRVEEFDGPAVSYVSVYRNPWSVAGRLAAAGSEEERNDWLLMPEHTKRIQRLHGMAEALRVLAVWLDQTRGADSLTVDQMIQRLFTDENDAQALLNLTGVTPDFIYQLIGREPPLRTVSSRDELALGIGYLLLMHLEMRYRERENLDPPQVLITFPEFAEGAAKKDPYYGQWNQVPHERLFSMIETAQWLAGIPPGLFSAGAEEETVREIWHGMRSAAPQLRHLVVSPSVARQFPQIVALAGMEERLVVDDGLETVARLSRAGVESVAYYGDVEEIERFGALSAGAFAVEGRSLAEGNNRAQLAQLLTLIGVPVEAIAAGLDALAAGLEALEQAA